MSDGKRSIELEVEVPGRPEAVWRAVATGPGISSRYVPHTVTERAGEPATASFGPEPEMQVSGRVALLDDLGLPAAPAVVDGLEVSAPDAPDGTAAAKRDDPRWRKWLTDRAARPTA